MDTRGGNTWHTHDRGLTHVTLRLRSLSLCWLCQIFCNPVSKFRTTLHWTHHECFNSQRRSEKRDLAIANKEKIRDSTISREDAIANGIKLAFKEQQSTLDSVVTSAVRDAGTSRVWWKEKLGSATYSHLPCAKMAWQIGDSERCSAGLSGEMHTGQCHVTIFSWL